ncbi:MAG: RNA polymerase sigma factor [Bacteroidetes bacterium]|nr:RNA polymerase sigma factor [Bacteroidota bacterium]
MNQNSDIEILVKKAVEGDKSALNALLESIQQYIYNISIKILFHPENAKDATQEILIKIVTHLSSFNFESQFTTWTYRIATNYLLNVLDKEKRQQLNFEIFAKDLAQGLNHGFQANSAEKKLWVEEVKMGCSLGMLQCLDSESRITYVLGEILEFSSTDGAYIQNISPETFRKRLSRARTKINEFTKQNCGLVNPQNACRCHKKVDNAITTRRVNPNNLLFASKELITSIAEVETATSLIQTNPIFEFPEQRLKEIKKILEINLN